MYRPSHAPNAKRRSRIRYQYPTAVVPKSKDKGKGKAPYARPSPAVGRFPSFKNTVASAEDIFPWEHATSYPPHVSNDEHDTEKDHDKDGQADYQQEDFIDGYFLFTDKDQPLKDLPLKQAASFAPVFSDSEDEAEIDPNDPLQNSDLWVSSSGISYIDSFEFDKKRVPSIEELTDARRLDSQLVRALSITQEFEDAASYEQKQPRQQQQEGSEQTTDIELVLVDGDDLLHELQNALNDDAPTPQQHTTPPPPLQVQPQPKVEPTPASQPRPLDPQPRTLLQTITTLFAGKKKQPLPNPIVHPFSTPPPPKPRIRRRQTGLTRAPIIPSTPPPPPPLLITAQHFLNAQLLQPTSYAEATANMPWKHHHSEDAAGNVLDRPGDAWSRFYKKYPEGMGVGSVKWKGVAWDEAMKAGSGSGSGSRGSEYSFRCWSSGDEEVEYQWAQGACW